MSRVSPLGRVKAVQTPLILQKPKIEEMSFDDVDNLQCLCTPISEHSWTFDEAFTTVASSGKYLFAGTVSGNLVTYDLETYQEVNTIAAHTGSILTLIVQDGFLFSGSSDSLIKVWKPARRPEFVYLIYMLSDIGDIFALAYNRFTKTIYIGAQNGSMHYVCISEEGVGKLQTTKINQLPAVRPSKFFDSTGPGGIMAPQQHETIKFVNENKNTDSESRGYSLLEVPLDNQIQFAHHSSIYAMIIDHKRNMMLTGSGDGFIKIWHFRSDGRPIKTHKIEIGLGVLSMCLASSWQLCCGLERNGIALVDLETFQVIRHDVSPEIGPLISVDGSNYNVYMAFDKYIYAYDTCMGKSYTFRTHDVISAVQILPRITGPDLLVTASVDGSINLWNVFTKDMRKHDESTSADMESSKLNCRVKEKLQKEPAELLNPGLKKHKQSSLTDDAMIGFLRSVLKYQTVSGRDCANWSESRRCASSIQKQMRTFGAQSELLPVEGGNPIVYARFDSSNTKAKTVLFYGHYDVIGAKNDDQWDSPPFQLTSRNGYLYGRGTTDNKGPCAAAMYAVASLKAANKLGCNVVFLVEGEEESGSFGLINTIEQHVDLFGTIDWILFSNSTWLDDVVPCINYGLRGVIFAEIEVISKHGDLHSGVAGGTYLEPSTDLIYLLSKLKNVKSGEILIPGFHDRVVKVGEKEKELYDDITKHIDSVSSTELMRRWRYPSLTIHKIDVSGPRNTTVIPQSVKAYVSVRIVPSQTAEEIINKFTEFVKSEFESLNSENTINISITRQADPWIGHPGNKLFTVLRDSVEEVWDVPPLYIREGGSIPAARALEIMFDAPAAQLPCGQSTDNAHLNNERIRIQNLLNARRVFEKTFKNL